MGEITTMSKAINWNAITIISYKEGTIRKEIACKRNVMRATLAMLRSKGYQVISISHID